MNTPNVVLAIGSLGTLALGFVICLLLRTFCSTRTSCEELSDRLDISWKHYRPLQRLLDPAEFQFLADRGISAAKVKKLKAERRRIYRLCLRSLAQDFDSVQQALKVIVLQSKIDRPDLAAELARQRITFYRNLALVEVHLAFHAWGFERMPSIDLLQPLESLSTQLRELLPANVVVY